MNDGWMSVDEREKKGRRVERIEWVRTVPCFVDIVTVLSVSCKEQ